MPAEGIEIDAALVEQYVMTLASFGAHGETGVWRTVYSPEWVAATDQYAAWCEEVGLSVRRDAVGNVWGALAGREHGRSVVSGSHINSQTPGGRYDGALGTIAALVGLRTLKEQFGQPRRTLEAVALRGGVEPVPHGRLLGIARAHRPDWPGRSRPVRGYRLQLHQVLLSLWSWHRPTVLFVTHDVDEALLLADRILVIKEGRLVDDRQIDLARPRTVESLALPETVTHKEVLLRHLGLEELVQKGVLVR